MRRLLLVALLLYNFVALATRSGSYDYEDIDGSKRHSLIDERRNWRKKALLKPLEEHKEWDRWRHDYDNQRYMDDQESKVFNAVDRQRDRERDLDLSAPYRGERGDRGDRGERGGTNRHYENENALQQTMKSSERDPDRGAERGSERGADRGAERHASSYNMEKEPEKKPSMNCDRPHERYEACFAGCASVTCDNPRDRLRPCYPFCEPGCICTHPYVRDDRTHKCVLPEECTKGLKGIPDLGDDI